ncbi:MAG: rubredoxin [Sulfurihydrogenibium sp.]|jgi:rubredoxin|uniref:Rubredoxin n=1 Tax=Sulfurihydrogenibium azorense TaxID=309806 RepID=A0A831YCX1_9AQUI|nr:MAG: rubredoxin [Sulfurihydrogenibium sp.]PMP63736.1 MAG: rubredoxin [Sulfurihydrogenibium sp.]PMP77622.1 MAG: rubredoxin [Sulfurihydrogenibium sp.]HEV09491.1 rubredoxin [Sulfurihydrogenibium azorense]
MKVAVKKQSNLKYRCRVCGYIYDPEKGDEINNISPGIEFIDLPDKWRCPVCNYSKKEFRVLKNNNPA